MSIEANKEIVRRAGEAFGEGNWEALLALMHEDVEYALIGESSFSPKLRGKEAVREMLAGLAAGLATPGITMHIENLIAEGEYVAEQARGSARTVTARPYNNTYCRVWRIVDGKVVSLLEYLDTDLLIRCFSD